MANHASHAALPYPIKGARYTLLVPMLDADGDPTDPTTPDTSVSEDGADFVAAAEEVTTIGGTADGVGYVTLTGAETDCSMLGVQVEVASGPKATIATLYPRVLPIAFSGTASAGAAGTITLATDIPAVEKLLIGCIVKTTGGTGGGGTGGANNQARVITAFTSGRVATVVPNWEVTPDNTTTYQILLTEMSLLSFADVRVLNSYAAGIAALQEFFQAIEGQQVTVDTSTFTPTTTQFETTDTVDDEEKYLYQTLFGITGIQTGITTFVTGYTYSGNNKVKLTVDALPSAPTDLSRFHKLGRRRST